jgi:hypothetical protein
VGKRVPHFFGVPEDNNEGDSGLVSALTAYPPSSLGSYKEIFGCMIEMGYGTVKLEKYVSWNIQRDIVQKCAPKIKV